MELWSCRASDEVAYELRDILDDRGIIAWHHERTLELEKAGGDGSAELQSLRPCRSSRQLGTLGSFFPGVGFRRIGGSSGGMSGVPSDGNVPQRWPHAVHTKI